MKTKRCTHRDHVGRRELPLAQFSRHPGTRSGRQSVCKECNRRMVRERAYRLAEERRAARGQEPLAAYRAAERQMVYREPAAALDYRDEVPQDVPLKDL